MTLIPDDIHKRIEHDFGSEGAKRVTAALEQFIESYQSNYGTRPSDRIIRCIVHLAQGKLDLLSHHTKAALGDWRDVIYWAEYDRKDDRIHDFRLPFK
jgi:hypothetical protein